MLQGNHRQRALDLLERLLDLVLSSRFWAALLVAVIVAWLIVTNPVRFDDNGRMVVPDLPANLSERLGLDDATLENAEPPQ